MKAKISASFVEKSQLFEAPALNATFRRPRPPQCKAPNSTECLDATHGQARLQQVCSVQNKGARRSLQKPKSPKSGFLGLL